MYAIRSYYGVAGLVAGAMSMAAGDGAVGPQARWDAEGNMGNSGWDHMGGMGGAGCRITSYNVCYTKLLRPLYYLTW